MTAPPRTSLCPPTYVVSEWTTTSMPCSSGFWNSGVAHVPSMTVVVPRERATSVMATRSSTFIR